MEDLNATVSDARAIYRDGIQRLPRAMGRGISQLCTENITTAGKTHQKKIMQDLQDLKFFNIELCVKCLLFLFHTWVAAV